MISPTSKQLKEKIAEVLGWTDVIEHNKRWYGLNPAGDYGYRIEMPDWPNDRNDSYELPVKDKAAFKVVSPIKNGPHSAYTESLTWLRYKGWRWEDEGWVKC